MQKFSACRKRGSSIHFFSSTSMRCIMAICPAGPPKLMQPILNQSRNASPKLGEAEMPAGMISVCAVIMPSRRLFGFLGRPVVPLVRGVPRPGEQRIVDHKAAGQQPMIVIAGKRGKAEGYRVQAGGFRRQIVARRVGTAHDQREACEM